MKKLTLTVMMTAVLMIVVSNMAFAGNAVEKCKGYVVRIGHLGQGMGGYVNISVEKEMDEDGYSQLRFKSGDTWYKNLEVGDEVFYLVHQNRIIKVLPTPVANPVYEKGGVVEKRSGYVVRIGHINQNSGYVNVSVEEDMDKEGDGYSQTLFRAEDTWQKNLEVGSEVSYLVYKKRIIKILPKK